MGRGSNGMLSDGEWLHTLSRDVDKTERAVSAKLDEADRARAIRERCEAKAATETDPDEIGRLEDQARAARRVEQAARNEAERIRRDELEPARAALAEGERTVADDAASESARRAADEKARFDEQSTPAHHRKLLAARARRAADLEQGSQVFGDPDWRPSGWVDEPDPPADADERAEALTSSYQPAKAAAEKAKTAGRRREQAEHGLERERVLVGLGGLRDQLAVEELDARARRHPASCVELLAQRRPELVENTDELDLILYARCSLGSHHRPIVRAQEPDSSSLAA